MGRLKKGATPEEMATYHAISEGLWKTVMILLRQEAKHTATCVDPECSGVIYPWLAVHLESRDEAVTLCAVTLERLADIISSLNHGLPVDLGFGEPEPPGKNGPG